MHPSCNSVSKNFKRPLTFFNLFFFVIAWRVLGHYILTFINLKANKVANLFWMSWLRCQGIFFFQFEKWIVYATGFCVPMSLIKLLMRGERIRLCSLYQLFIPCVKLIFFNREMGNDLYIPHVQLSQIDFEFENYYSSFYFKQNYVICWNNWMILSLEWCHESISACLSRRNKG